MSTTTRGRIQDALNVLRDLIKLRSSHDYASTRAGSAKAEKLDAAGRRYLKRPPYATSTMRRTRCALRHRIFFTRVGTR
jgi:hypothetical protein